MKFLFSVLLLGSLFLFQSCSEDEGSSESRITGYSFDISSVDEGDVENTVIITVTANGTLADPVTVNYALEEESAKGNDDFLTSSGSMTFGRDQATAEIPVTIVGDDHFELTEQFRIKITSAAGENIHLVKIMNDDAMATIQEDAEGFYTPADYPSMNMVWSDEFDGNVLNEADWNYELGDGCDRGICGWGNQELQSYTNNEDNVKLEEGRLVITARKSGNDYSSARITTQDKQEIQFGRIDIRAKLPKGQGIWPALWMLGANIDQVSWPACGEIDIMELVGHEPEKVHGTVHFDNGGYQSSTGSYSLNQGDFSDKYHVFTLVWEQDRIAWYVDNVQMRSFSRSGNMNYPFNSSFFFICNVAVGGLWPGNPDGTTVFPQTMEVDYIRVFN